MKKHIDAFKRLRTVMKDVNGDNRPIIKTMQDQIYYLMEFIAVQGEIIEQATRRMWTAKFERYHFLAVCFTDTEEHGRRHNSDSHNQKSGDDPSQGALCPDFGLTT